MYIRGRTAQECQAQERSRARYQLIRTSAHALYPPQLAYGVNQHQPLALPPFTPQFSHNPKNEAPQIPLLAMSPSAIYHGRAQKATSSSTRLHHILHSKSRPASHLPYPIPLLNPPRLLLPTPLGSEKRRPFLAKTKRANPPPSSTPSSRLCHKT